MKVDLTRLDKEFMTEMLVKTWDDEIDLDCITYMKFDDFVKIKSNISSHFITVRIEGFIDFAYDDNNLDIISDILNRLKTCDNCKHWKDYFNGTQGTCDLCINAVDGEDVSDDGVKLEKLYNEADRVELSCDSEVYSYANYNGDGEYNDIDLQDIFCNIKVLLGKNFTCPKHEFKED